MSDIKSFVRNCQLIPKKNDTLFHVVDGSVYPTLDGYTIIPSKRYELLIQEISLQRQQEIFDCCLAE